MNKPLSLLTILLIGGITFANAFDNPNTKMVVLKNGSTFRLLYKGAEQSDVKVLILNDENQIVFAEKIKNTDGFARPYNFTNLPEGHYSIQIKDNAGVEKMINVDGLFVEMGSKINLDFVKHLIKLNTKGEIEVSNGGKTSHPAIFASGDATNIPYKQIVAACGDGAAAGISAFNYVEKLKGKPGIRSDWKKTIGDTVFHY